MATTARSGVLASVGASCLFGAVSFLAGRLRGIGALEAMAWRAVFILVALALVLTITRGWGRLAHDARAVGRSPRTVLVVMVTAAIMGVQMWLFMWAPAHGRGRDVALGYFLLPLVMVLVGRVCFRDTLTGWQRLAVGAAAFGVAADVFGTGSLGWPTLLVAGLYPFYFGLRRWCALDSIRVLFLESALLSVPAVGLISWGIARRAGDPAVVDYPVLVLMAALSGVAMTLYIVAAQRLSLSLFGLLSYLEPVLLLGAALLLGERLTASDAIVYGPIGLALACLALGATRRR